MSLHASFSKRFFAFIIDTTIIIAISALLFLFPFQQIINKNIDPNYKGNVTATVNSVNTKYSGKQSVFKTTEMGEYGKLSQYTGDDAEYTVDINAGYVATHDVLQSYADGYLNNLISGSTSTFDSTKEPRDQYYSKVYDLFTRETYMYQSMFAFPMDDEYNLFSDLKEKNNWSKEETQAKADAYAQELNETFEDIVTVLVRALNNYSESNPDASIFKTLAYEKIGGQYYQFEKNDPTKLEGTLSESDIQVITDFHNRYDDFVDHFTDIESMKVEDHYKLSQQAYYIYYYDLMFNQFHDLLNVYEKYDVHSTWVVIYSLSMFTIAYSLYTIFMHGNTLGRRAAKIKLTDGAEREKLNPIKALLHDVLFRFLYLLLIGCFDIRIMAAVTLVTLILDAIMIKKNKNNSTLRDIITKTFVVDNI